ncbi:Response regulator receiver protein [Verrucomicrobia bacterium]|nr:Response regulator receiver protein [Verrucomicrobiota bacterium]
MEYIQLMRPSHSLVILLVEDDENDILLTHLAVQEGCEGHALYSVHDGDEAIRYLRGEGQFADRGRFPVPNVIPTDLKMPRMSGFDLLCWLRSHAESSVIPIIVLTSSDLQSDVLEAYRLGANCYITKPATVDGLIAVLHATSEFWSRCEWPAANA